MKTLVQRYRKELGLCRRRFQALDLRQEKGYFFKYTTFSANMQNLLPEIAAARHEPLFQEMLLQQVYTTFDQQFLSACDFARVTGPGQTTLNSGKAHIYVTFHLGSYRLLNNFLFRSGVDLALMVGSKVYHEQGPEVHETIEAIRQKHKLTNSFRMIDAEDSSSTLQTIRELRAGKSLLIYIDGMTGSTGVNRREDKELRVRLGSSQVWTRKGVGFLSHMAHVPIVPVLCHRDKDLNNILSFRQPISPDNCSDREEYCQKSLQTLYDEFWGFLKQYPSQWEGWTYIHNFLDIAAMEAAVTHERTYDGLPVKSNRNVRRISFNEDRYTLMDLASAPVLFDRRLYLTYEISADLRDFLLQIGSVDSPEEVLGSDLYLDLLSKQILC